MDPKFELKANALIAAMLDAVESGAEDIADEMHYVTQDLELTDDAIDLSLALMAGAATAVSIMASMIYRDPKELWFQMIDPDV